MSDQQPDQPAEDEEGGSTANTNADIALGRGDDDEDETPES